jgi:hypothetical protein
MKRLHWLLFLLCLSLSVSGQRGSDYGVFAGVSSYLGDINPNRLMYSPLPAAGIFYRYNLNPRQALRANLFVGGLRANDLNFDNTFQQTRAASFSGYVAELGVQYEFNFFPYSTMGKLWDYTPYLAAGVAATYVNTVATAIIPVIPFSVGFKINIHKNVGLEAEYGFRKTFYDNFDGLKDLVAPSDYGIIHNNDWYSFAGVAVTWKFFSNLAGCPAYGDDKSRKKR